MYVFFNICHGTQSIEWGYQLTCLCYSIFAIEHNHSSGANNYCAGLHQPQAACHIQPCREESHQGALRSRYRACIVEPILFIPVEGLIDISCVRLIISYQVKITGAKKGLVHVSQNIPTKSALSVSLTRPEDVIIQVLHSQHTIVTIISKTPRKGCCSWS